MNFNFYYTFSDVLHIETYQSMNTIDVINSNEMEFDKFIVSLIEYANKNNITYVHDNNSSKNGTEIINHYIYSNNQKVQKLLDIKSKDFKYNFSFSTKPSKVTDRLLEFGKPYIDGNINLIIGIKNFAYLKNSNFSNFRLTVLCATQKKFNSFSKWLENSKGLETRKVEVHSEWLQELKSKKNLMINLILLLIILLFVFDIKLILKEVDKKNILKENIIILSLSFSIFVFLFIGLSSIHNNIFLKQYMYYILPRVFMIYFTYLIVSFIIFSFFEKNTSNKLNLYIYTKLIYSIILMVSLNKVYYLTEYYLKQGYNIYVNQEEINSKYLIKNLDQINKELFEDFLPEIIYYDFLKLNLNGVEYSFIIVNNEYISKHLNFTLNLTDYDYIIPKIFKSSLKKEFSNYKVLWTKQDYKFLNYNIYDVNQGFDNVIISNIEHNKQFDYVDSGCIFIPEHKIQRIKNVLHDHNIETYNLIKYKGKSNYELSIGKVNILISIYLFGMLFLITNSLCRNFIVEIKRSYFSYIGMEIMFFGFFSYILNIHLILSSAYFLVNCTFLTVEKIRKKDL